MKNAGTTPETKAVTKIAVRIPARRVALRSLARLDTEVDGFCSDLRVRNTVFLRKMFRTIGLFPISTISTLHWHVDVNFPIAGNPVITAAPKLVLFIKNSSFSIVRPSLAISGKPSLLSNISSLK